MTRLHVLALSGSLRAQSSNAELLRAAGLVDTSAVALSVYDGIGLLPHFISDDDREDGVLPAVVVVEGAVRDRTP